MSIWEVFLCVPEIVNLAYQIIDTLMLDRSCIDKLQVPVFVLGSCNISLIGFVHPILVCPIIICHSQSFFMINQKVIHHRKLPISADYH